MSSAGEEIPLTSTSTASGGTTPTSASAGTRRWTRSRAKLAVICISVSAVLALFGAAIAGAVVWRNGRSKTDPPSVILMIGDGLGPQITTLARLYAEHYGLPDPLEGLKDAGCTLSLVSTRSASHVRTDSSAAATAFACARKTTNGFVGLSPDGKPCGTVLEAAAAKGFSTGVVVKTGITHATPAAFTSHSGYRSWEQLIASQQVDQPVSIFVGGGRNFFNKSLRADGVDLLKRAEDNGFTVAKTKAELDSAVLSSDRIMALLQNAFLPYEIDRKRLASTADGLPTLKQNVDAALDFFERRNKPFFLLVEGSLIDFAGHSNDVSAEVNEVIEFFTAVNSVVKRAAKRGNTAVFIVADHDTGGVSLDGESLDLSVIGTADASVETMAAWITSGQSPSEVLASHAGVRNPTAAEVASIATCNTTAARVAAISKIVASRLGIHWGTVNHTATNVILYSCQRSWDKEKDSMPMTVDNTDIPKWIARHAKLDLAAATRDAIAKFGNRTSMQSFALHDRRCGDSISEHCAM